MCLLIGKQVMIHSYLRRAGFLGVNVGTRLILAVVLLVTPTPFLATDFAFLATADAGGAMTGS